MTTFRNVGVTVIGIALVLLTLSPRRRRAVARRLVEARRLLSHRILDEEARASSRAVDAWEDDGGASDPDSAARGRV